MKKQARDQLWSGIHTSRETSTSWKMFAAPRRPFYYRQDYRSRQPGYITKMLEDLNLASLQHRRRERSASSSSTKLPQVSSQPFQQNPFWHLCGTRGRLRPPADLTSPPATSSRGYARNNSRCFSLGSAKTRHLQKQLLHQNSF